MNHGAHRYFVFDTAAGFCAIAWNERGITRFQLPSATAAATERHLKRRTPNAVPDIPPAAIVDAVAAAQRYFDGEAIDFSQVVLDLDGPDEFFARVYAALRRVAWGRTTTYGALARELGAGPERARDVGQAMARNPVPLIIPCHRVLAAGGKVGGFSAPGGAVTKQRMLALEGVRIESEPTVQASLAL